MLGSSSERAWSSPPHRHSSGCWSLPFCCRPFNALDGTLRLGEDSLWGAAPDTQPAMTARSPIFLGPFSVSLLLRASDMFLLTTSPGLRPLPFGKKNFRASEKRGFFSFRRELELFGVFSRWPLSSDRCTDPSTSPFKPDMRSFFVCVMRLASGPAEVSSPSTFPGWVADNFHKPAEEP